MKPSFSMENPFEQYQAPTEGVVSVPLSFHVQLMKLYMDVAEGRLVPSTPEAPFGKETPEELLDPVPDLDDEDEMFDPDEVPGFKRGGILAQPGKPTE